MTVDALTSTSVPTRTEQLYYAAESGDALDMTLSANGTLGVRLTQLDFETHVEDVFDTQMYAQLERVSSGVLDRYAFVVITPRLAWPDGDTSDRGNATVNGVTYRIGQGLADSTLPDRVDRLARNAVSNDEWSKMGTADHGGELATTFLDYHSAVLQR